MASVDGGALIGRILKEQSEVYVRRQRRTYVSILANLMNNDVDSHSHASRAGMRLCR